MLIVTASDNNYVAGVMVLIASTAYHNPTARFAVLDMGISTENRQRIDRLAGRLGTDIQRLEIDEKTFCDIPVAREHLNRSTYLRLLIPDLFPTEDRIIYLDCDMVVLDSLDLLEAIDLEGNIVAAVPCPSPSEQELRATGHVLGTYVNAGLLVMNLPLWRQEQFATACIGCLTDPQAKLLSEDQSAINIQAKGRIKLLPTRYNMYSDPNSYKRVEDCPSAPAVVHYVVNNKPWFGPTTLGQLWQLHADRIGDLIPLARQPSLRRRLSRLNASRKQFLGTLMGRRKYRRRQALINHMSNGFARDYILKVTSEIAG